MGPDKLPGGNTPADGGLAAVDGGDQALVMCDGVVCELIGDARVCAAFPEGRGGLFFDVCELPIGGADV